MAPETGSPARFTEMTKRAGRNKDASRAAVSILKADSHVSQVLERALRGAGLSLPQFNVLMELASSPDGALPLYEMNKRLISPNRSQTAKKVSPASAQFASSLPNSCFSRISMSIPAGPQHKPREIY